MQREIISYFKYCDFIDVLTIQGGYDGDFEDIHREYITHKIREDYTPFLRQVMEILRGNFRLKGGCSIGVNEIIVDGASHSIKIFAEQLKKQGYLYFDDIPLKDLFIFDFYRDVRVRFETENIRYL